MVKNMGSQKRKDLLCTLSLSPAWLTTFCMEALQEQSRHCFRLKSPEVRF